MIIERWTWVAKTGCRAEVIKLVKAMVTELGFTPRVCTYQFGSYNTVVSELEFESEEDIKKFWAGVDQSKPAWVEWHKRNVDLTVPHHTHERLWVH
jgi:hypothetical protein